jgi:hypothetical protein
MLSDLQNGCAQLLDADSRSTDAPKTTGHDFRNAILCGLAVVAAVAFTLPVCNSPFDDDWSYSFTVKRLLETGKITYNGWASASLIAQAYWGLLWVKVFGFSFTVLRFSALPLAAAAISFCYLLGRRVGLSARFAVFAALLVGLSPIYLPIACTFMTDAPGLFFIFCSMYLLSRCMDSASTAAAIGWLVAGVIVGLVGGSSRQIVWLVPLIIAPYAGWLRRGNLVFLCIAIVGWLVSIAVAYFTMRWFAHQPYSMPEIPIRTDLKNAAHQPAHFLLNALAILLTALWMILPALWGIFRGWTPGRSIAAFVLLIGPVMLLIILRPHYAIAPWMISTGNCLHERGVMGNAELAGVRPVAMPMIVRIVVAFAVFFVACALSAHLILRLTRPVHAGRRLVRFFLYPGAGNPLLPAMVLFAAGYFALLLPRCASNMVYDRYIVPLMPCLIFPLLLKSQKQGDRRVPKIAWGLLAIFAIYSIAITQEITALARARTIAADRLLSAGVRRTRIDGGFEFNYQTQIETVGYVNDSRLRNPAGAYRPGLPIDYAVQPEYRLEFGPAIDSAPTHFGSVRYFTYLYPFHRAVYIDRDIGLRGR